MILESDRVCSLLAAVDNPKTGQENIPIDMTLDMVVGYQEGKWGLKYEIFSQAKKRKNHLPRPTAASG